jgi:hypothetical protein
MNIKNRGKHLLLAAIGALAFLGAGSAGAAEQCRDANGRFIKCPPAPAAPAARCRDITSKRFVKCGSPNSEAVPKTSSVK